MFCRRPLVKSLSLPLSLSLSDFHVICLLGKESLPQHYKARALTAGAPTVLNLHGTLSCDTAQITTGSYANSVDPDQSSNMRGLDSDKISQVC